MITKRAETHFIWFGIKEVKFDSKKKTLIKENEYGGVYLYEDAKGEKHLSKNIDIEKVKEERKIKDKNFKQHFEKGMI